MKDITQESLTSERMKEFEDGLVQLVVDKGLRKEDISKVREFAKKASEEWKEMFPTKQELEAANHAIRIASKYLSNIADGLFEGSPAFYVGGKIPVVVGVGSPNYRGMRKSGFIDLPLVIIYYGTKEGREKKIRTVGSIVTYESSIRVRNNRLVNPPTKVKLYNKIAEEVAESLLTQRYK